MDTLKYIAKRLGLMLLTLFIIFTIVFVLIKLLPSGIEGSTQDEKDRMEALGYNKPIITQYFIYLANIFSKWDWGTSWKIESGVGSSSIFISRIPPTLMINIFSFIVSVPLGLLLGFYIAQKKNKWQDHAYGVIIMIFISLPSFVFAFILQYFLAYKLGLLDLTVKQINTVNGWFDPEMLISMMLPTFALAIPFIATISRNVRAELSEQLNSDYMLLARAKGLSKRQATFKHCFKNAMVPVLPTIIAAFILSFSAGSMVIEQIFNVSGTGTLYLSALTNRDYDVFMLVSMFFVFVTLMSGLISDLSFSFLDPRIKVGR